MTDLANLATEKSTPALVEQIFDGQLMLPNKTPTTVYTVFAKMVQLATGAWTPAFSLGGASTDWYTGGVEWAFHADQAEYGLFVTFVLLSGIEELEVSPNSPPFWFSSSFTPGGLTLPAQSSCMPALASTVLTYHFRIVPTFQAAPFDPVIVVTPISGDGNGNGHGHAARGRRA
jgi:hypothetical protein